jgi:tRNA A37 methylthiotransferase MiaB
LKDISRKNNEKEIGNIKEILINKINKWVIEGYTDTMKQVLILNSELWILNSKKVGEFLTVKIIKAIPFKLYWEII